MGLRFWIPWGIGAVVAAVAVFFFLSGLVSGSVSSFNAGIWAVILAVVAVVLAGSLWLRSVGRPGCGLALVMVLVVPAVLSVIILLITVCSGSPWI